MQFKTETPMRRSSFGMLTLSIHCPELLDYKKSTSTIKPDKYRGFKAHLKHI